MNVTKKHIKKTCMVLALLASIIISACGSGESDKSKVLFSPSCYPYAVLHNGKYYVMRQTDITNRIDLLCTDDIRDVEKGTTKTVWMPTESQKANGNIWSPELHRIGNKWYIYFEADDGNTDNHQLYVLENPSDDPMKGQFKLKGVLKTNDEWNYGIHPSTFVVGKRQYLVWSGWPKRRSETETQCIYIAGMKNPWTVNTRRVKISTPTYEWERQWINPNGTRSAYPIYVNENPQPIVSKDGKKVAIYYSASGCWTVYSRLGAVYANTNANLLDSTSWHKAKEPVMISNENDSLKGLTDICVVENKNGGNPFLLFEAKYYNKADGHYVKQIRLKNIKMGDDGLPMFKNR